MKTKLQLLIALLASASCVSAQAQNPVVTYQGRVTANGTNLSGTGQFKVALVTVTNTASVATATANLSGPFVTSYSMTSGGSGYVTVPEVTITGGGGSGATATAVISGGVVTAIDPVTAGSGYTSPPTVSIAPPPETLNYTTYWSNDGTSSAGSEPTTAVNAMVGDGLFTLRLGDPSLANMMALDGGLFQQANLHLRIWFNDGVGGFAVLSPTQPLTATPYAITASQLTSPLGSAQLNGTYSGAVTFNNAANSFTGNGAGLAGLNANNITSGTLAAARLPGTAAQLDQSQVFSGIPAFNGGTSGASAPFSVDSTFLVANLNAALLDGQSGSFYQNAGNLTGTLPVSAIADSSITAAKLASDAASLAKITGGRLDLAGPRMFLPQVGSEVIDTNAFTGLGFQYYWGSGEGAILSSYNDGQGYLAFYTKAHGNPVTKRMTINQDGHVGINTASPGAYLLYVNGNAFANGTWGSSDARLKKNVRTLTNALEKVRQLRGVTFEWRCEQFPERALDEGPQMGFLAQEVAEVAPELVKTDASGFKALSYDKLTAVLAEGIKEQQAQIEAMQSRNACLERSVGELKSLVQRLLQTSDGAGFPQLHQQTQTNP